MGNEYEKAIGIWNHKIVDIKTKVEIEHKIVPKEGDNLSISKIMKGTTTNGIDWMYTEFNKIYFDMVIRDTDKPLPESEHQHLKNWIEKNQVQIQKDMLVEFGWQTKEQQEKLENMDGDTLKKLINA